MRWLWIVLSALLVLGFVAYKPLAQKKVLNNIALLQIIKAEQPQTYEEFVHLYEHSNLATLRTHLAWYMQRVLTHAAAAKQAQFAEVYLRQLEAAQADCKAVAYPEQHDDGHSSVAHFSAALREKTQHAWAVLLQGHNVERIAAVGPSRAVFEPAEPTEALRELYAKWQADFAQAKAGQDTCGVVAAEFRTLLALPASKERAILMKNHFHAHNTIVVF